MKKTAIKKTAAKKSSQKPAGSKKAKPATVKTVRKPPVKTKPQKEKLPPGFVFKEIDGEEKIVRERRLASELAAFHQQSHDTAKGEGATALHAEEDRPVAHVVINDIPGESPAQRKIREEEILQANLRLKENQKKLEAVKNKRTGSNKGLILVVAVLIIIVIAMGSIYLLTKNSNGANPAAAVSVETAQPVVTEVVVHESGPLNLPVSETMLYWVIAGAVVAILILIWNRKRDGFWGRTYRRTGIVMLLASLIVSIVFSKQLYDAKMVVKKKDITLDLSPQTRRLVADSAFNAGIKTAPQTSAESIDTAALHDRNQWLAAEVEKLKEERDALAEKQHEQTVTPPVEVPPPVVKVPKKKTQDPPIAKGGRQSTHRNDQLPAEIGGYKKPNN